MNDQPRNPDPDPGQSVLRLPPAGPGGKGPIDSPFLIDTHFPGGNAIIESIIGDTVHLRPDARDAQQGWFWWSIRVRGAAGKSLSFVFSEHDPVGVYGPAVSLNEGLTWQWMGNPDGSTDSFRCAFPQNTLSVRLSCAINYTDLHWQRFCGKISWHRPFVREEILCLSRKGRAVPRLHVGRLDGKAKHRILLTARHHACETMANYAIEGAVLAMLKEDEAGEWLRENVELIALPFMDRDGVEDGDSGKGRQPHDHNRDYGENNLYPETRALREFVLHGSDRRLAFMADLHCPWIRGNSFEQLYQVAKLDPTLWAEQRYFGEMLTEASSHGPLFFKNVDNPFFGDEWQAPAGQTAGVCAADWCAKLPGMRLATSFEIPYASCTGVRVNADGVRTFGSDLAHAICQYLKEVAPEVVNTKASSKIDTVPLAKIYTDALEVPPHPDPAAKAPVIPDGQTNTGAHPPIKKFVSPGLHITVRATAAAKETASPTTLRTTVGKAATAARPASREGVPLLPHGTLAHSADPAYSSHIKKPKA